jgi:hypothetical protein
MASIFLTTTCNSTSENQIRNFESIVNLSKCDIEKKHHIAESPDTADIVLFIGDRRFYHSGIYSSDIFKEHHKKSLVLDFADRPIPRIPGLYTTIPLYLQQYPIYEYLFYPYNYGAFDFDKTQESFSAYKYLFSFMGNVDTYPSLRSRIVNLVHPQAYLKDTTHDRSAEIFSDVLISSKFILCPRGIAASTIRVFEAMRASRVPVIISDEWQPPYVEGNWKEFSIVVAERDIESIPNTLEALEPKAIEMGEKARLVWEEHFSVSHGFHWLVEACLRIQNVRNNYEHILSRKIYSETFGTHHFIPFWKEFIRNMIGRV